jgi:hypothetical protein
MANDLAAHPPALSPPLSRERLTRVLGLSEHASVEDIVKATRRLVARLDRRLAAADAADPSNAAEVERLRREMAELAASCAYWADPPGSGSALLGPSGRWGLVAPLIAAISILALLIAYAAGYRLTRLGEESRNASPFAQPAALILSGAAAGATLRVFDADRQELFAKLPAENAYVELDEGRYAIEVTRDDCPDKWTQSVYFEPGDTHEFEPEICLGQGEVTVRSNVSRDRLLIDGVDVGATGTKVHEVAVGDHEIRIEKTGFEPYVAKVRIGPDETLELRAELVSRAEARGGPRREAAAPAIPVPEITPFAADAIEPFDLAQLQADLGLSKTGDTGGTQRLLRYNTNGRDAVRGGSTAWHDRVSREFLARFDADRSGAIDLLDESEAIPCAVWRELERDFNQGGLGLSMAHYFGFDGSEWHPDALGFARSLRSAVYEKMKECGLES